VPDPVKLLATIKQATQIQLQQRGRTGKFVELEDADEIMIIGDMHGHLGNFKQLLQLAKLHERPNRHVLVQELIHGPFRYAGMGGEQSHRLVDIICAYICQYPGRVHYLLGNHELAQWTKREIAKNNESLNLLFAMGVHTSYPEHMEVMLAAYDELFISLPVAFRLPNGVFLSHSLPPASKLDAWSLDDLKKSEFTEDDYKLGGCIHSVVWGRDTSEANVQKYLSKVGGQLLISGHIPCEKGYDTPNSRQIIIDGKDDNAHVLHISTHYQYNQEALIQHLIRLNP
jgi:hypothetical protein